MSLFRKKAAYRYDLERQEPAVRKSICTGEMTVGYIDRQTGQFHDLMKVDGQRGLDEFCREAGISEIRTVY